MFTGRYIHAALLFLLLSLLLPGESIFPNAPREMHHLDQCRPTTCTSQSPTPTPDVIETGIHCPGFEVQCKNGAYPKAQAHPEPICEFPRVGTKILRTLLAHCALLQPDLKDHQRSNRGSGQYYCGALFPSVAVCFSPYRFGRFLFSSFPSFSP